MGLEMKPGSKWWYGRFRDGKTIRQVRLDVEIEGERPAKVSEEGDRKFERSRGAAKQAFEQAVKNLRADPMAERAMQRLVEIKTGKEATFPKLVDLPALWAALPRRHDPTERHVARCRGALQRFVDFVAKHQPNAKEFVTVTPETTRAFLETDDARKLSPKTWNDTLKLLRATFKHLHPQLTDGSNPFHGIVTKAIETVNREPFAVDELQFILDASKDDPFIRPIILTGMLTAMRRGDCCLLKWDDVDLKEGFLTVKTAKTGETVDIPIFPMLRDVLEAQRAQAPKARKGDDEPSGYVFPEAAAMYLANPDGITWRVKGVLAEAFKRKAVASGKVLPEALPVDVLRLGREFLDKLGASARVGRMRQVFESYMSGKDINDVMAETGMSKGSVSGHLNEIEQGIRVAFIRGKVRQSKAEALQSGRAGGARRASIRDFHSFRVTWITLALAAGVPLELVQRVTGHRTVEVVLKHYFRPGRENFRQAIEKAMPKLLLAGGTSAAGTFEQPIKVQIQGICTTATVKTWKRDLARINELAAAL
ncbi:MAG: tyrosine-type recombinase/integrase [Lentisphaerae bacterium]|nr:tyrosine-type recombinase/integrase [Lentisphaerota bacterium]